MEDVFSMLLIAGVIVGVICLIFFLIKKTQDTKDRSGEITDDRLRQQILDEYTKGKKKITRADLAKVEELKLRHLSGVEVLITTMFPNLRSIDLIGGYKLRELYINSSFVTEINLAEAPNLEELGISNTSISELDLSKLPMLMELHCEKTRISKLDLSSVPQLNTLYCLDTAIKELDLQHVPQLRALVCRNTPIKELDLSHTPELIVLDCAETAISSLDITCLPQLDILDCSETKITSLDLSRNSKLDLLQCYDNPGDENNEFVVKVWKDFNLSNPEESLLFSTSAMGWEYEGKTINVKFVK